MAEQKETLSSHPGPVAQQEDSALPAEGATDIVHEGEHHDMGFEPEAINALVILGVVFATSIVVVGLIFIGFTITEVYAENTVKELVAQTEYPEIRDIQAAATAAMNESGVVDADAGIYRVPVERAMEVMAEQQYTNPQGNFSEEVSIIVSP